MLDEVSWAASAGELMAVMGASGAGKSTMLSAISGNLPASLGGSGGDGNDGGGHGRAGSGNQTNQPPRQSGNGGGSGSGGVTGDVLFNGLPLAALPPSAIAYVRMREDAGL